MSERNKVVWSEGLFLRPQHLQQQERYFEDFVEQRVSVVRNSWGVLDLDIDQHALKLGKIALNGARGIFPDGTPYSLQDDASPAPLDVPTDTRDKTVYLALPIRRPDSLEVSREREGEQLVRYALKEWEARDVTLSASERVLFEVSCVRPSLVLEGAPNEGLSLIPIARIQERRPDNQVVLDNAFMPTALDIEACPPLRAFLSELIGMVKQHADAVSEIVVGIRAGGVAEIADLIRLQLLNRYEPVLKFLDAASPVHAEELYAVCIAMCGELATMSEQNRRVPDLPVYKHHELNQSFEPVVRLLRNYLTDVGPSKVTVLNVEKMPGAEPVYRVKVPDPTLFDTASFYVAVSANMESSKLRDLFQSSTTLAPTLLLKSYWLEQRAGIRLEELNPLPPQLPFLAGYQYYRLDPSHETWKELPGAGAFGLYVPEVFPGLDIKMWAMRH